MARADEPFEVINAQVDAGGAGNGQQVQHRIGGATHRHDHADGVFEGVLGERSRGGCWLSPPPPEPQRNARHAGLFLVLGSHRGAVGG